MTRRGGVPACAALLAVLGWACAEPTTPDRSGIYSFADTIVDGNDTTIYLFRWPAHRLPVRFWTDPRGNLAFLVDHAIGIWEEQFLYGEFRGTRIADSTRADVIVRWADSVPPDVPPDAGPPVNACGGLTMFDFDTALIGPVQVSLTVFSGGSPASPGQVQACLRRVAIHELGHALGLGFPSSRHSGFDEDVMFGAPLVAYPSRFDRRSAELLYHLTPTIGPPPP